MFNKIRNRYVMTNMLLLGSLIIISFGAIYLLVVDNMLKDSEQLVAETMNSYMNNKEELLSNNVMVILNSEAGNETSKNTGLFMRNEELDQIVDSVLQNPRKKFIKNNDKAYRFLITKDTQDLLDPSDTKIIVIHDITNVYKRMKNLLIVMILIIVLVLSIIFMICLYLANKSVDQLKKAWDKQRQFIGDASHELKTPLSIIESNIDALSITEQNKWTNNIKGEVKRMNLLLSSLLYLTKIDDYDLSLNTEKVNISEILSDVILAHEADIFEKGFILESEIENNIWVNADSQKIKQLFYILLDNAIKYGDNEINISMKQEMNIVRISFENSGSGIAPENLDKIFNRFYKEDKSRKGNDNSYGLGLSIAKAIVDRMDGQLYVQSVVNEKTKFTIIFNV